MQLIFEKSHAGRGCDLLPACDVPEVQLPEELKREQPLRLPQLSETEITGQIQLFMTSSVGEKRMPESMATLILKI